MQTHEPGYEVSPRSSITIGFVKLISKKKYGKMLYAHLIVPVTELLAELPLASNAELSPEDIPQGPLASDFERSD